MTDLSKEHFREMADIKASLLFLKLGAGSQIVTADRPDLVEMTAARELQRFFRAADYDIGIIPESSAAGRPGILLGRAANCVMLRGLIDTGDLQLKDVPAEDDGFHIKKIGKNIVIAGANPRGVLYGVYAFEGFIRSDPGGSPDIRRIPYFRKRSNAAGYYWDRYLNLRTTEFTEEQAEYLARSGVNQYCSCEDVSGFGMHLHELVHSDVFPFQNPPNPDFRRKVKATAAICKKYGIDYFFMLWEPVVAQIGADLDKYPAEALGTVRRPWGGDMNGLDRTLCVNSPLVQAHYRNMIGKFVREFPDVAGIFFYNLDGSSWLCTPELCARCANALIDSPPDRHNPWETQALLVSLLAEAAHAERPEFEFNFWAAVHFHGEAVAKMLKHARGCTALTIGWDGSDHDIMLPAIDRPCVEFQMTQAAAAEKEIPLYLYFAYNRLESVAKGLPFPFHVCAALQQFKSWGVKNLIEVTGAVPAYNSVNTLAMQEFQNDPDQDPAAWLKILAGRQFGPAAGTWMYRAWEEIRDAFNVWNGYRLNPLSGSQPYLSIGTIGGLPLAILPDIAVQYENDLEIRTTVEPWRADDYRKFKSPAFLAALCQMGVHLDRAARFAQQAVGEADSQVFIGICSYRGQAEGTGRPTCREYAELNQASIAIADNLCQQRINILRAVHLLNDRRNCQAAGDLKNSSLKEMAYRDLIRTDIILQERFVDLLTTLYGQRPTLSRASLTANELEDFIQGTQTKIAHLHDYLAKTADPG